MIQCRSFHAAFMQLSCSKAAAGTLSLPIAGRRRAYYPPQCGLLKYAAIPSWASFISLHMRLDALDQIRCATKTE